MKVLDPVATGQSLKSLVRKKGLTTRDVMMACNLTTTNAVTRWYRGAIMPSLDNLIIVADLLGVTMDEVVRTKEV